MDQRLDTTGAMMETEGSAQRPSRDKAGSATAVFFEAANGIMAVIDMTSS
jgi:hypothetical protein